MSGAWAVLVLSAILVLSATWRMWPDSSQYSPYCIPPNEGTHSEMIIVGKVVTDGTVPDIGGWSVFVYEYLKPPAELFQVAPIGEQIAGVACDAQGRFEVELGVQELASRNVTKVVVFASANPANGTGWEILEVVPGTFEVDLTASSLPPLPVADNAYRRLLEVHETLLRDHENLMEEERRLEDANSLLGTLLIVAAISAVCELGGLLYLSRHRR